MIKKREQSIYLIQMKQREARQAKEKMERMERKKRRGNLRREASSSHSTGKGKEHRRAAEKQKARETVGDGGKADPGHRKALATGV